MELVSQLKTDHKNIRRIVKQIELLDRRDLSAPERFNQKQILFKELADLLLTYFKAEEIALYSSCLKIADAELSEAAVKGFEEHNLLEDLMHKIDHTQDFENWDSQVKVFCQVLEMHLSEEENEYFPSVSKHFSAVDMDRASVLYLKVKKSEIVKIQHSKKHRVEKEIQLSN